MLKGKYSFEAGYYTKDIILLLWSYIRIENK